jgi:hypothetical protein
MRVSMVLFGCFLVSASSASAQDWYGAMGQGRPTGLIAGERGLAVLQGPAFQGQREASALLAVTLQDNADVENNLVKSALHFQLAIASGCTDLDILAVHAVGRLSPEQRAAYEQDLPHWVPATQIEPDPSLKGPCLRWWGPPDWR